MGKVFLLLSIILCCSSCAFWPISWEFNDEKRFLGPLVSYQRESNSHHLTFRPLLASYDSHEEGVYNFLYPLGHVRKEHSYFLPIYRSKKLGEEQDTAFALFFWGKSKTRGNYGGFFPFYGKLFDRYGKDEINFLLWPLYSHTRSEGALKTDLFWPIFSLYGGKESGFKAFPIYGERALAGVKESRFFLWPLFISEDKDLDTDEPSQSFYVFPLYLQTKSKTMASYYAMWPLFSYIKDSNKERWGFLANLYSYTEGEQERGYSLFPLVSDEQKGRDDRFNLLWPLYHQAEWYAGTERFMERRVLVINRYLEEKDKTFLNAWPFFEYESQKGDYNFLFPSLLPFRVEGMSRIIKPLFTLYEHRQEQGITMVSILYGLYTQEHDGGNWRTRFAFLFELKKDKGKIGCEILSGLFGWNKDYIKIFFVTIER